MIFDLVIKFCLFGLIAENVFSSLVGLQFMWHLMPETDGLPHHLVHVPLKDSPLSDCGGLCGDLDIQIRLEDSGVYSDLYVVKGTEIGHENVSVHLLEPLYEHMADKIVLTVAEAMSLDPPSPVFVLIGAIVPYTLKVIRANIPQVVTLPSPFHQWSVLNSSVAQVDRTMGKASALNLGITIITVEDTRVPGHLQMSSLHVVQPDTLSLYMLPLSLSGDPVEGVTPIPSVSRWYVVSGRQYLVHVKVFSQGPGVQEIYITETDDVKLHDQSEYWNTFSVSDSIAAKHGWWNCKILKATSYGLGKLTATLAYSSGHDETKEVLKIVQEVMVCDEVKISKDIRYEYQNILLPWAPGVYQEVELKATGGCAIAVNDYKWFSSDMASVSVSASGIVQAKRPGKATIKVVSIFDSFNYDEVVIEVLVPTSMVMLPHFPVETVVGSHLAASVSLKASTGATFYSCDAFSGSIRWKTGNDSFVVVNATRETILSEGPVISEDYKALYGPPCAWTRVYASSSGRTMLHATLTKEYQSFDHSVARPLVLKASSHIEAFLPLVVHQTGDGNQFGGYWFDLAQAEAHNQLEPINSLYLAPGTHIDVILRGGPEPREKGFKFIIEPVDIINEEHTDLKDGVLLHQMSTTSYGRPFRILCRKLGTFKLTLFGDHFPAHVVASVTILVTCSFPSSIVVIADEAVNAPEVIWAATQADHSLGRIRATPITVANGRTIRLSAVGISDSGKAFANSSSLHVEWETSNCDGLADWDDASTRGRTKSSWERFLVLQNSSGLCIVRATVVGFTGTMKGQNSVTPFKSSESVLTDAIRLQLVYTLRVSPEFNLLFFHPDAKLNLSITGGSCFLDSVVNDTQIVEVIQSPPGSQCSQLVVSPRGLGTALVTVYDIGLAPQLAASAVVQVADVEWIKITSGEEISLMEGSSYSIGLLAGDIGGNTFDSSQYIYMNIHVHIEDHIVELVDNFDNPTAVDGYVKAPNFIIRARNLGFTTLYLSARQQSGHEILSQPIRVEVYAPPTLHPGVIFLVPGASYVLTVKGGPTIGSYVEYASINNETAVIHKTLGRLSAIAPGNTTVVAKIYGNGDTVICQAYGSVKVGVPSSAILKVQSEQLAVGREMPIFPSLSEGNLFSFYELCNNYKWNVEDEELLTFQGGEIPSTGYSEQDLGFIQMLYGRSAGRTKVAVSFSCDFNSSGSFTQSRLYNASLSLLVVPDLPLALGASMTWLLPPHYTTSNLLPLSSNSYSSQGDPQSRKGTIAYSLLREWGGKNEEAQKDAVSIDGARIKTREGTNLACIQAKDRITGRTEVASCVRVAEIAQVRISTKALLPFHKINLAVGAELVVGINYHDALGNAFLEAYNVVLFDAETNYADVVSINDTLNGNGNIHLKAMHHGKALVQISFSSDPQKADYFLISVGAHLYPQNPVLHLGSRVNFSIEGINDLVLGQWSSANSSVVSVDLLSGKAEAIGEGTTHVIFGSTSLKLQTAVTVLKGSIVSVDAPRETLTNTPFPAKGYAFFVKFNDAYNDGAGTVILYDCGVDPPFVGYAKPWRDLETGNSYCLFFPYSPEHLVGSIPKSKNMRQDVSVSINASVRGVDHISGSASALFVGGFSVLEMSKNSLQLNMTPHSNKSIVTIVGNTDVEVHWSERDLLMIVPVHREDYGIGGRAEYEFRVLGAKRFRDKVVITLPANGQRMEIDVNYEPGDRRVIATKPNFTLWAAVVGCLAVLVLTVALFIYFLDRPDRSQPTIAPATPITVGPVTPDRSSPTVVNGQSPRTPQPFVEYLRRTIDETPHYRREPRRRVNPQNTF